MSKDLIDKVLQQAQTPVLIAGALPDVVVPVGPGIGAEPIGTQVIGLVDSGNSTADTLDPNETFIGAAIDATNYGIAYVTVFSDVASAVDGLAAEQSSDGVNWDNIDEFNVVANTGKTFSFQAAAQFFRVVYTNGAVAQSVFRLQTVFKGTMGKPSSHRIQDSISDDDDAELVKAVITARDNVSGTFVNITSTAAKIDTHVADIHQRMINRYIVRFTGTTSNLNVNASAGDTSLTVVSDVAFTVGDWIQITENSTEETSYMQITAKPGGNVLTLDRPLDNAYTTVTPAVVEIVVLDMATAIGTLASPISFTLAPPSDEVWHIWRLLMTIQDGSSMDTSLYAGSPALTNGVLIRINNDGVTRVLTNWKKNADMMEDAFDIDFHDKAPAGSFGLSVRWTIKKTDAYIHLDGSTNDFLEVLIQDDLTVLENQEIKGQGHIAE